MTISGINFSTYMSFREAFILYGGKEIPILGINEFKIEVDRLQASYNVWVSTSKGQPIADINASFPEVINMTPIKDLNVSAHLKIDNYVFPCKIQAYSYAPMKHAYCVSLSFVLDRDKIKTYIYDKDDDMNEEITRFDILDLRED